MRQLRSYHGTDTSSTSMKSPFKHDAVMKELYRKIFSHYVKNSLINTKRYWNWELDWEDLAKAPVWHSLEGFGGNGDDSGNETVGHGRCVSTGPFVGLEPRYYDKDFLPHCLSRDFLPPRYAANFSSHLNPASLDQLLQTPTYFDFLLDLEDQAHTTIPIFVRGDFFSFFTAPNGGSISRSC